MLSEAAGREAHGVGRHAMRIINSSVDLKTAV